MNDHEQSDDRMDELESRLAFQDDLVGQLNDVVVRQDRLIANLRLRLVNLEKRMEDMAETAFGTGDGGGDEAPPHY